MTEITRARSGGGTEVHVEQVAVESDGMSLMRIFNDLARFFF
jgi:hypothetical protein